LKGLCSRKVKREAEGLKRKLWSDRGRPLSFGYLRADAEKGGERNSTGKEVFEFGHFREAQRKKNEKKRGQFPHRQD